MRPAGQSFAITRKQRPRDTGSRCRRRTSRREWNDAWKDVDYSYDELLDADDHVVALVTRHGHGRASGIEVERPFALVWTVRNNKIVRVVWFLSRAEALEAAGLPE